MDDMIRDYLVCESDFPCEGGWIGDIPDEREPPGRELAEFLQTTLHNRAAYMSNLWNEEGYGWSFNFDWNRVTINLLVQYIDHWLITCGIVSLRPRFLQPARYESALSGACYQLDRVLRSDNRFRDRRWYSCSEYEQFARNQSRT
jgi:hypothetical protein